MADRPARYETIVYPVNRNPEYGKPVVVYATNSQEAINRAIEIGWNGSPADARVRIDRIEDVMPVTSEDRCDRHGLILDCGNVCRRCRDEADRG